MIQTPKISKKDNEFTEHLENYKIHILFLHIPQKHNNTYKNFICIFFLVCFFGLIMG